MAGVSEKNDGETTSTGSVATRKRAGTVGRGGRREGRGEIEGKKETYELPQRAKLKNGPGPGEAVGLG